MHLRDVKEVEPGKTYALEIDSRLDRHTSEQIIQAWREQAPDSKLLILDGGMRISELTEERVRELREMGVLPEPTLTNPGEDGRLP